MNNFGFNFIVKKQQYESLEYFWCLFVFGIFELKSNLFEKIYYFLYFASAFILMYNLLGANYSLEFFGNDPNWTRLEIV